MHSTRLLALTLATALTVAACGGPAPEEHAAPPAMAGVPHVVEETSLVDAFEASGVAEPRQRAMISSTLMARVTEVLVHEGDQVRAGQVLVRLDARDLAAKAEQAQAGLAAAEAAHGEAQLYARRIRALYADSAAPRAQLDAAEAALVRAEAGVRQARAAGAELEAVTTYATLRAPFAGVVTQRLVDPGDFAAPGRPVVTIEDPSSLRITVTAAPDAVRDVRRRQLLRGTVAGEPVEAVVEGVVSAAGGHVVTVNAVVRHPVRGTFAGSAATLLLPLGERRGLMIPAAALVHEGDLTGVHVLRGGASDLRWVRTGAVREGMVEVRSGLTVGDTILVPAGRNGER
jgi:RND family efflux transporter MFP subunit